MKIYEHLDRKSIMGIHLISLVNVVFLTIYTRLVCPFLNTISFEVVFINLLILFIVQVFLREASYLLIIISKSITLSRQLYLISVATWIVMGFLGAIYNELYFENYPFASQLKVLSGYWILGAGICGQIEYLIFEKNYKNQYQIMSSVAGMSSFLDKIPKRITESSFIFTLAPTLAMLTLVIRYSIEENILSIGVIIEVAYIGIFFLTVCLLTSFYYGKILKKDTQKITKAIFQIKEGIFDIELNPNRSDELGVVSKGVLEMASGLKEREKIKEAFGRFVNPSIAKEFIEKYVRGEKDLRRGEKKRLAILMCDIRNFTNMSEVTSPEKITKMLNSYFTEMVQVIEKNGGIIDKFIGDAIMGVFGLLNHSSKNPSLSAVQAGILMQRALEDYNKKNNYNLKIGIGVHVGEVVAGYLGSENRLEYTVIGSPVNIASRIEGETKDPDIPNLVFTKEVADDIASVISSSKVKACKLKGIKHEVTIYAENEEILQLKKAKR